MARILVFAGSARRDSLNKKLARVAAEAAREAGAEVTLIDSPGAFGGVTGLTHLRPILAKLGVIVIGDQVTLPRAHEAFDETGRMKSEASHDLVRHVVRELAEVAERLTHWPRQSAG